MSDQVKQLPLDVLDPSEHHSRADWGDMDGLAASIEEHGIIEPMIVRARPDSGYWVVCGERRRRAALKTSRKTAPCIVVDIDDVTAIAWAIAENSFRSGNHDLDLCHYYAELGRHGFDPGDIARRFGVDRKVVIRRLKLAGLSGRARDAFARNGFDFEAALALARMTDLAKQDDVIAAVTDGALQPEEIAAYCLREYSASLAAVPWKVGDAGLVATAGACSACPKRSGVQRDLFSDDVRGDRCLDVACFRSKMDATYAVEAARDGVAIHDVDAPNLFIPTAGGKPAVMRSSGMIDRDASCPHLVGHTWGEALRKSGAELPTEYLCRDQDGAPRFVYSEAIASRIVKKSDAAATARADADAADPMKSDDKVRARAEIKVRRALVDQIAERAAASDVDAWGWIVERVVMGASARAQAQTIEQFGDQITELGEGHNQKGLLELVRKSNRRAKQVAIAILVREEADLVGDIPPSLPELAKLCAIDIKAIERGIRKDRE